MGDMGLDKKGNDSGKTELHAPEAGKGYLQED